MFFLLSYLLAAAIGYLGYRARALSASGAVAACVVGGTVFGFGGIPAAVLLVAFFASSSLLSFFRAGDPAKRRATETFEKGGRRDAAQVMANGGVAALAVLLSYFFPSTFFSGAFVGALSAATADTWATELGVLSKRRPRLLTTGAQVQAGTSGAVTLLGSVAAAVGTLFIGLSAALLVRFPEFGQLPAASEIAVVGAALIGGTAGSIADSLLGATIQARYYCPVCDKPTESKLHRCGTRTTLIGGLAWVNNDLVNLAATVTGALVGGTLAAIWSYNELVESMRPFFGAL
ncbi:MAG: hypothetical protein QOH93_2567 [Chloroflexia bacterium]|jgi:uncharacterized protein (TIGR00297 family)|nr:hypothetical protein [Chloroflexia bacterium]